MEQQVYAIQNEAGEYIVGLFAKTADGIVWGKLRNAYFYNVKQIADDIAKQANGKAVVVCCQHCGSAITETGCSNGLCEAVN